MSSVYLNGTAIEIVSVGRRSRSRRFSPDGRERDERFFLPVGRASVRMTPVFLVGIVPSEDSERCPAGFDAATEGDVTPLVGGPSLGLPSECRWRLPDRRRLPPCRAIDDDRNLQAGSRYRRFVLRARWKNCAASLLRFFLFDTLVDLHVGRKLFLAVK